ncbi:hypothetical protein [Streptomyces peucetius]|uniref:Uncharacterized protein n=1 Tax=Streptomyces peucetius TaxID=1950 RepID=A0ABY6HZU1_STRPE|nr:hypothetical protein [Streptomyces peucetius]UYQ60241.1 hypothetical protein OGH68_01280 [Streptomyces peucetius]
MHVRIPLPDGFGPPDSVTLGEALYARRSASEGSTSSRVTGERRAVRKGTGRRP